MSRAKDVCRIALMTMLALGGAGCAATIGTPQASLDSIQAVRQQNLPPLAVGSFAPGPKLSASDDKSTMLRAINTLSAPGGSFSGYLKSTIETDLRAAGGLDPNAPFVLQGVLTSRDVDSSVGTGTASLVADFTLVKDGKPLFEKTLSVDDKWDSSFIGAVAIPDAINHFTQLFGKLSVKLLTDADFKAALH